VVREARSFNSSSSLNGIIIRSTANNIVYDVFFPSAREDQFARPAPESEDPTEQSLQDDLITIEDFFSYFHDGIKFRVEEAMTRLVSHE